MRIKSFLLPASMLVFLSGCATTMPVGSIYTGVKLPVTATTLTGAKEGSSSCVNILSMIATGDCSIDAAKKDGGITKVSAVDWEVSNILGVFGRYKVHVYGE